MKTPGHIIGLRKDIRTKINKQAGDVVLVVIQAREYGSEFNYTDPFYFCQIFGMTVPQLYSIKNNMN